MIEVIFYFRFDHLKVAPLPTPNLDLTEKKIFWNSGLIT